MFQSRSRQVEMLRRLQRHWKVPLHSDLQPPGASEASYSDDGSDDQDSIVECDATLKLCTMTWQTRRVNRSKEETAYSHCFGRTPKSQSWGQRKASVASGCMLVHRFPVGLHRLCQCQSHSPLSCIRSRSDQHLVFSARLSSLGWWNHVRFVRSSEDDS